MNIGQWISDIAYQVLVFIIDAVSYILPMDFMKSGYIDDFQIAIYETLVMFLISAFFSFLIGLVFGTIITVTKKGGILENRVISIVLDIGINFFRSVPFVILIALLLNVTKLIVGTRIGVLGALVPLVFGTVPFFARQVESALSEVDGGLIEASKAMGDSPIQIIFRVYLKESIPSIARGTSITLISLLGLTAMAGQVGGGGLGAFAVRFGYGQSQPDATWSCVIAILLMVTMIQVISNKIVKKTTH